MGFGIISVSGVFSALAYRVEITVPGVVVGIYYFINTKYTAITRQTQAAK